MPPIEFSVLAATQDAIFALLSSTEWMLVAAGIRLFQGLSVIVLVLFGVNAMYHDADIGAFIHLVLRISVTYSLVYFYATPLPVVGISTGNLIPAQASWIANLLDGRALENVVHALAVLTSRLTQPGALDWVAGLVYVALLGVLALVKFLVIIASTGPLLAVAVIKLLGPVLVPFLVFEPLEWIFYSFLRSLAGASFCMPVGAALTVIFATFIQRFVTALPPTIAPSALPLFFIEVCATCCCFAGAILFIPRIAAGLFNGPSAPHVSVASVMASWSR